MSGRAILEVLGHWVQQCGGWGVGGSVSEVGSCVGRSIVAKREAWVGLFCGGCTSYGTCAWGNAWWSEAQNEEERETRNMMTVYIVLF